MIEDGGFWSNCPDVEVPMEPAFEMISLKIRCRECGRKITAGGILEHTLVVCGNCGCAYYGESKDKIWIIPSWFNRDQWDGMNIKRGGIHSEN